MFLSASPPNINYGMREGFFVLQDTNQRIVILQLGNSLKPERCLRVFRIKHNFFYRDGLSFSNTEGERIFNQSQSLDWRARENLKCL